jgi:hypothetical protein
MQAASIRFLNRIPGPEATAALVAAFPKLPPAGQAIALAAMADRGDASARPVLAMAANSVAPEVRLAALTGLGKLGDGSTLNLLAERAASRGGSEQAAARESLYRLPGANIDSAVVEAIGSAAGKIRVEFIRAAAERGIASAAGALIASARDPDREVRRESIKALKDTASAQHGQALLDLIMAAQGSSERREAGRTLAAVLRKTDRPPVGGIVSAYQAAKSASLRALLLEVLGQLAAEDALPVLRSGFLGEAMRLAKQPEEKKSVLALLPRYASSEAMGVAEGALNDPAVANEAKAAMERIGRALQTTR